ncbi:MAG: hypothetical protein RR290_01785 [Clostridia bacterium]
MKKLCKHFCIPCITLSILSILFIFKISCITNFYNISLELVLTILVACIFILIGIFTDSTYIFKRKLGKK